MVTYKLHFFFFKFLELQTTFGNLYQLMAILTTYDNFLVLLVFFFVVNFLTFLEIFEKFGQFIAIYGNFQWQPVAV